MGSEGHCIVPELNNALQRWAARQQRPINYVMKGQNLRTEMYSALEAEVEDPNDPNTALNSTLVAMLKVSDRVSNITYVLIPLFLVSSVHVAVENLQANTNGLMFFIAVHVTDLTDAGGF